LTIKNNKRNTNIVWSGDLRMKVKIEPRDQCLGDDICVNLCPAVFARGEDGKAVIVEQYRAGGNIAEGEVPDDLRDCVENAAQACPVGIIIVE